MAKNCNTTLLPVPDHGKAWNNVVNDKRWELECEENYELERSKLVNLNILSKFRQFDAKLLLIC